MKKTLIILVALLTATIAFTQTEINGIYYNLNNESKTAEVTYQCQYSYDGNNNNYYGITTITIPEKITYNATEYNVNSIGNFAFFRCSTLTSISIPNSINSIGNSAFSSCSSLTSISIPNSVTSIGYSAFSSCSSLTSISIPNSVTSIENSAFSSCSSLTSIDIDAKNLNYTSSDGVLYDKNLITLICCPCGKTSISIPNSVTSIGDRAFANCDSLKSITIPNSVTSIGYSAFWSCSSLTSITIESTTPPTLNGSLDYNGIIYIPDNTHSAYKETWGTKYFFFNNENTLTFHIETPGTLSDKIFETGQQPAFVTTLTITGTLNDDDFTYIRETMTYLVNVDLSGITNDIGTRWRN